MKKFSWTIAKFIAAELFTKGLIKVMKMVIMWTRGALAEYEAQINEIGNKQNGDEAA